MKCGGCRFVQYCCKEHQTADWKNHKEECKVFKRVAISCGQYYTDEMMLKLYPLRNGNVRHDYDERPPKNAHCCIMYCYDKPKKSKLCYAPCCGGILCDNADQYQLMSYSRDFCSRSHERYTLCGAHGVEDFCDDSLDWRVCPGCDPKDTSFRINISDALYRGLNAYNFCPLLEKRLACLNCSNV